MEEDGAFRSEITGVLDAIRDAQIAGGIKTIMLVERDSEKAERLRRLLPNILVPVFGASEQKTPPTAPPTERGSHSTHSAPEPATTLFLCYRRDDTQDAAGRLCDRLFDAYGPERVFMDIDSVPLGIDFFDHVTQHVSRCSAVIVMIGRQWLSIQDRRGRRRLETEDDLVRAEVAAALEQKVPVIPVLVQDAEMPHADDLPENIRLLARRNGISLSATRWRTDVERLIKELDRVMKS